VHFFGVSSSFTVPPRHAAMRLFALAGQAAASAHDAAQIARLMNAAARQMDTYQAGMLALMKFKAAGKQTVIVHHQHVTVADGGQAVIAASIKTGGFAAGGEATEKMIKAPDEARRRGGKPNWE
jgi:hypothetical protein